MVILTNAEEVPDLWAAGGCLDGRTIHARSFWRMLGRARKCDLALVNCDPWLTLGLSAAFAALP